MRATLLGIIGLICVATAAQGQLVGLNHLWTVPGALNTAAGLQTYIACSNVNTSGETIGVDIYGPSGSYVVPSGTNSVAVAPGATVLFGTGSAPSLSVDVNLAIPIMTKGLARILSTASKGTICSAFLADTNTTVPAAMVTLTVVKKTKQKGD